MKLLFRGSVTLLVLCHTLLPAVEIIAHRGASHDAPENTLAAMKLGWEQNADGVELDLWLSRDGKLLVFHDQDTRRFEKPARNIKDLTLTEARKLDVGAWKDARFQGEPVPALEDILATVPPGKRIVLELKDGPELVPEFVRVLRTSGLKPEQLCVISFQEGTLRASRKSLPEVAHYFLKGYKKDPETGKEPELEPLITLCQDAGFDGLNLHSDWPVTPEFAARVKAAKLKLLIWTVDEADTARRLAAAGVDGITTNRPAFLRAALAGATP